jgi:hypothetical protein
MKQFLVTFFIISFILACFFWETGFFFSNYGLVPNILTFLFFNFILFVLIVALNKFFKFIKKIIRKDSFNEIDTEKTGKISRGLLISSIIFVVVLAPEALLYFVGGALGFVPLTITTPFLLSVVFSFPFLVLNFIFFLFSKGETKRGLKYGFLLFIIFFVIIFGINLYIFINYRETYYSSQDIEKLNEAVQKGEKIPCDNLRSQDAIARCFYDLAIEEKDLSLCDKISGDDYYYNKDMCYSEINGFVGVEKNDINLCSVIKDELTKVACIQAIAAKNQKPEYCTVLSGTDYADACYYGAIEKMTDKNIIAKYCALMKQGMVHQQNCFKLLK